MSNYTRLIYLMGQYHPTDLMVWGELAFDDEDNSARYCVLF
jgi:hypothetical protein